MNIRFNNSILFKKIILTLKNIFSETILKFNNDGLLISEFNNNNSIFIEIFFNKYFFNQYELDNSIYLNINLIEFYKCLKSVKDNTSVSFEIFDKNNLKINVFNKNHTTEYLIKINIINKVFNHDMNIFLKNKIIIQNKSLVKALETMITFTNLVLITIEEKKIILVGKDDFNHQTTELNLDNQNIVNEKDNICNIYFDIKSLNYILNFGNYFCNQELHYSTSKNKPFKLYFYSENIYIQAFISPILNNREEYQSY